ncbi:MAG: hypothetical protein JXD19_07680 [Deltaproteobacteria bacterium]|nr:hypothetical protein [Deltaproteobacteria bacterium]
MAVNPFLTTIAKQHHLKIEEVLFCRLERGHFGLAQKRKGAQIYRILIDKEQLACIYREFFTFFHELAHICLGHLELTGYANDSVKKQLKEGEADLWAWEQMGILDKKGGPKPKYQVCYNCMAMRSPHCLREKGR